LTFLICHFPTPPTSCRWYFNLNLPSWT